MIIIVGIITILCIINQLILTSAGPVSAGPALSYSIEGFGLNLSYMPQLTNLKTGTPEFHDNQRLQTRLIFTYEF